MNLGPDKINPVSGGTLVRETYEEANIAAGEYGEQYGLSVVQVAYAPSGSKVVPDKWIFLMRRLPNQSQPAG